MTFGIFKLIRYPHIHFYTKIINYSILLIKYRQKLVLFIENDPFNAKLTSINQPEECHPVQVGLIKSKASDKQYWRRTLL